MWDYLLFFVKNDLRLVQEFLVRLSIHEFNSWTIRPVFSIIRTQNQLLSGFIFLSADNNKLR